VCSCCRRCKKKARRACARLQLATEPRKNHLESVITSAVVLTSIFLLGALAWGTETRTWPNPSHYGSLRQLSHRC